MNFEKTTHMKNFIKIDDLIATIKKWQAENQKSYAPAAYAEDSFIIDIINSIKTTVIDKDDLIAAIKNRQEENQKSYASASYVEDIFIIDIINSIKTTVIDKKEEMNPKFTIESWITSPDKMHFFIKDIKNDRYVVENQDGETSEILFSDENLYNEWTYEYTKPGDFLKGTGACFM